MVEGAARFPLIVGSYGKSLNEWRVGPIAAGDSARCSRLTASLEAGTGSRTHGAKRLLIRGLALSALLFGATFAGGCGAGSEEEVERSMREFQLAASLRDEGNVASSIEHLHRAIELDPENARAHLLLGYIHDSRRDFHEAERYLREGIRLLEEQPEQRSTLAEAKNMLGGVLLNQHRVDEAIPLFRASASDIQNGAPYHAWANLGRAFQEKGDHDAAIEALTEAVRLEPRFCLGHYLMGHSLFATRQYPLAEEALTRAIESDARCESFQEAFRLRGETRAQLGHREDAIGDFERCVELGSRNEAGLACRRFLEESP